MRLTKVRAQEIVKEIKVPYKQQEACITALLQAQEKAPVDYSTYDAVDLACDTGNYWWTGLENEHIGHLLKPRCGGSAVAG